ncbi:MAG: AzlD domain-containing protein [Limnochordales bacterium]
MDGAADGHILLIILGMAAVTYGPRALPLLLLASRPLPPLVRQWLGFLPPALMAALVVQAVLMPGGQPQLTLANPAVVPALVSIIVAWRTRSLGLTVVAGMAAAAAWHRLGGG